jgi:hypothetical protein
MKNKFKVGDKVRCVYTGGRDFQQLHSQRNRLVKGKIYTVRGFAFGEEILLKNKKASWLAFRFEKVQ